jgi:hypothetical protein
MSSVAIVDFGRVVVVAICGGLLLRVYKQNKSLTRDRTLANKPASEPEPEPLLTPASAIWCPFPTSALGIITTFHLAHIYASSSLSAMSKRAVVGLLFLCPAVLPMNKD